MESLSTNRFFSIDVMARHISEEEEGDLTPFYTFLNILILINKNKLKMCSLGDDVEIMRERSVLKLESKNCIKCRTNPPYVVLRSKDAYCKECFVVSATHKFKAILGKSRLVRPNDKVLVCYKVGHPSTALLHLLRNGLDLNAAKMLKFEPVVIFIEDQYHLNVQERQLMLESVKKQVEYFKFNKAYYVSFVEYVLNPETLRLNEELILEMTNNDKERLFKAFDKKATKTCRDELKHINERNLLLDAAKQLNCKFVFTPELSVDIASNLLTNMTLGRGSQIPLDTGFCDDRDDSVKILRPLRLFDIKELAFYNNLHNVEPVFVRQKQINPYSSVHNLVNRFVNNLQNGYPATVTTIVKTGDKLSVKDDGSDIKVCLLCRASMFTGDTKLTSAESTEFSRLASKELLNHNISRQEKYSEMVKKFHNQFSPLNEYCYSCLKIKDYLLQ